MPCVVKRYHTNLIHSCLQFDSARRDQAQVTERRYERLNRNGVVNAGSNPVLGTLDI